MCSTESCNKCFYFTAKCSVITFFYSRRRKPHWNDARDSQTTTELSLFVKVIAFLVLYIRARVLGCLNQKAIYLGDVQINDQLKSSSWRCFTSTCRRTAVYSYACVYVKHISACWLEEIRRSIWPHISLLTFREFWYANGTPCMCHLCNVFCCICVAVNWARERRHFT